MQQRDTCSPRQKTQSVTTVRLADSCMVLEPSVDDREYLGDDKTLDLLIMKGNSGADIA